MEYHDLIYEQRDHIATITLDNPDKLNAMTGQMLASFSQAIERVRQDDEVRVLVLTGAGRGFCTGADTEMLIALAQGKPVPGAVEDESRRHAMEPIGWFGVEVSQLEKPTIAAINGAAVGVASRSRWRATFASSRTTPPSAWLRPIATRSRPRAASPIRSLVSWA